MWIKGYPTSPPYLRHSKLPETQFWPPGWGDRPKRQRPGEKTSCSPLNQLRCILMGRDPPRAEVEEYWKGIWERKALQHPDAQWLVDLRAVHSNLPEQEPVSQWQTSTKEWRPGPHLALDVIHIHWLKKLTALQKCLPAQWLTQGRTVVADSAGGYKPGHGVHHQNSYFASYILHFFLWSMKNGFPLFVLQWGCKRLHAAKLRWCR